MFDTSGHLLILDVENGCEAHRTELSILSLSLQERVNRLVELDVDVLICGAISRPLESMVVASGIKTIPWLTGEVEEVLEWYLTGKPTDTRFLMPGCGRRQHRYGGPRRRRLTGYQANYREEGSDEKEEILRKGGDHYAKRRW